MSYNEHIVRYFRQLGAGVARIAFYAAIILYGTLDNSALGEARIVFYATNICTVF